MLSRKLKKLTRKAIRTIPAVLAVLTLVCLLTPGPAFAAVSLTPQSFEELSEEMHPGAKQVHYSLRGCIAIALKNNLDIEIEGHNPAINDALVQVEKGVFDPHVYLNATYIDREDPLPVRISIATGGITTVATEQWFISGGITGAIPTGLVYDANLTSEHTPFSTITDFLEANGEQKFQATLSLTQPLLKNFGTSINTTGIRVAEKNKEASVYQLQLTVLETVFEVEQAYWELVYAYENLRVRKQSLLLAQDLLEENRVRLKVGVLAPLDVLQSEAGVAFREEDVIVARSAVGDAKDRLIKVTNLSPDEAVWDFEIIPEDEPTAFPPVELAEGEQLSKALANRPELKQLLKQQEAAVLGARYAKNQTLPALDLNVTVGYTGLDEDFNSAFIPAFFMGLPLPPPPDKGIDPAWDDLFSGDNLQWMVGFKFEVPWERRFERGQYSAANLQVSQLDVGILSLRQFIIFDTRSALRGIETNWQRVLSTRETTEFSRESLRAEQKKYEVGVSTAHDLLEFEEELAEARANEQRAIIDYTLSLSNLLRATGDLLKARSIEVVVDL